ncbi:uncharacterized protein B0H18DRAFT_1087011 [Fomitopsis serialis]|uniref:uncharacterized protein n=1 Tax=Fomitopsis serialis TaxID=139415 RepID=UPI002007C90E|nr:uncharacterized protein B0H18DRAFT_1087011 [Neoantrodia serialis]KAH9917724.1 hypothetical protein B0H18DRAFT_1087011 [Neoantrodia serialis]
MHSIFSRARTISTPKKSVDTTTPDEFGRVNSRGSARGLTASPAPGKKDKKDGKDKGRARTASAAEPDSPEYAVPDGTFLPLSLDPPRFEATADQPAFEQQKGHDYGHLSYQRHVVLGLEEVARLVDVVGNELALRGLTTPFIFSALALDVSSNSVKRLIRAFVRTCSKASPEADHQWHEEARLAGPQELGMCLRWGLARVIRIMKGQEVRGVVSYENYLEWRDAELAHSYPESHFAAFLAPLAPLVRSIIVGLLTLLSRFIAHSGSSGHTPPTLSPLFGPLLFGLGPSTLSFHQAYVAYSRVTTATEHLILAFIRWQDAPKPGSGASAAPLMGVPTRLKAWIQGYPAMLPAIGKLDRRPEPRRGARTVRVVAVRRNVRMYSPDLVKTAASWAQRPRGPTSNMAERAFVGSREWERVAPPTLKLPPRYSDAYRKRMDLAPNFHPATGAGSTSSSMDEDRFRSLTDLKWGEFEAMGFGDVADGKKLQFDLTEGARAMVGSSQARAAKRATLTWQDFSSSGFSRTDAPLNATLQFSTPVTNTVNSWPAHSVEIHRKLKKAQKALPSFGWDTEPVLGSEEVVEEAFVDVFCDLVYGGGWLDIERCEEVDRECNWALVEFKSLPMSKSTVSGTADPRTSSTMFLFEEFVPLEYRQQLASSGRARRRMPSFFGNGSKSKQWKPAATLNGRPYVVGHVPSSPSYREVEFEGLLRQNGTATKVISLARPAESRNVTSPSAVASPSTLASPNSVAPSPTPAATLPQPTIRLEATPNPRPKRHDALDIATQIHRRTSRFRLPTGLPVSPGGARRSGLPPAEYESIDFDARLTSFSDDDLLDGGRDKHGRRRSRDDAWVDILVANNNRRMASQDAELRNGQRLRSRRSDPELASQELSEVLAAVRGQPFSDDEDMSMEPVSMRQRDRDDDGDTTTMDGSVVQHSIGLQERDSYLFTDDETEEEPRPRQRRPTYFDLHPDRRPPRSIDGQSHERQSYDSDAFSTDSYGQFDESPTRPRLNGVRRGDAMSDSYISEAEYETTPSNSQVDLSDSGGQEIRRPAYVAMSPPSPNVPTSPAPPRPPRAIPVATPGTAADAAKSKTASLIEMYREREKTTPGSAAAPSKLPLRSVSLPQNPKLPVGAAPPAVPGGKIPDEPTTPTAPAAPKPTAEPSESDVESILEEIPEPNLPVRYIHGAPLHNVLEEEEEED